MPKVIIFDRSRHFDFGTVKALDSSLLSAWFIQPLHQ